MTETPEAFQKTEEQIRELPERAPERGEAGPHFNALWGWAKAKGHKIGLAMVGDLASDGFSLYIERQIGKQRKERKEIKVKNISSLDSAAKALCREFEVEC